MGFLRVLLALSVLIAHSEHFLGIKLIGGRLAVETFFIISGFYMSLVLTEKYGHIKNSYKLFISNRFLRLLPIYWVVLFATIAVSIISGLTLGKYGILEHYVQHYSQLNWFSRLYVWLSNIFLIGQDAGLFMRLDSEGALHFTANYRNFDPRIYHFFVVGQAWTLALEFMFYMLSPFLVKLKNWVLLTIISICLICKVVALSNGLNFDPWIYRFFPFELTYFLLGIISYRVYTYSNKVNIHPYIINGALPVLLIFIIAYSHIPNSYIKEVLYFLTVFITVPFIYKSSKSSKVDRYIGEYSYTIYISHFLILDIVKSFAKMNLVPKSLVSEVALLLCVAFSYLLIRFISNKIDAYRERRVVAKINFNEDKTYPLLFK